MKKGFTLIELILVILIIGIIASVLIPTLTKTFDTQKSQIVQIYNQEQQVVNIDTENNILTDTTGYKMVDVKYDGNIIYCIFEPIDD